MDEDLGLIVKRLVQVISDLEVAVLGWVEIHKKIDSQKTMIKELEETMKGKGKKGKKGC